MKFTLILASVLVSVSARPFRRDVDPSLIPEFGATAGVNPDGSYLFLVVSTCPIIFWTYPDSN